ncbi:MAG TPA: alginate export family protein [Candidatus Omnitrophota bacterium]|nr:alginate export family protein [Candidatus Omnitrophota bacterium]HRZ14315.1 alginate export family protein [Candidatus Omnitrophota bacterium]
MMRRILLVLGVLGVLGGLLVPPARAEGQDFKYKWGFSERLRHEYWKNNRDMENTYYDGGDRNYFRIKTSVWGQMDFKDLAGVFVKLSNENKAYMLLGSGSGATSRKMYYNGHNHWDPDEVIFDNLYLDLKRPAGIPWTFRIGRQDLMNQYGENFMICDGNPGDGSRTFYFNAIKASWTVDEKNVLDLVYINNPRDDIFLPVFNEDKTPIALNTTDENGFVAYLKNKSWENVSFEPYFMYKKEAADYGSGLQSRKSRIFTPGAFVKYTVAPWTYRLQLAKQYGSYGDDDRNATGGYFFVDRDFKDAKWQPQLTAGFAYLSGDKKSTVDNEGWNPLFSRFPLYSELYGQSFQGESGNSYWTNLEMLRCGVTVVPSAKMKFNVSYSLLRANELVTASAAYSLTGRGQTRGHLILTKLDYVFNKRLTGYVMADYFLPNHTFYTQEADPAVFVRTQLEYKF